MKKKVLFTLAVAMGISIAMSIQAFAYFSDMDGHWAADTVNKLVEIGVIEETGGNFHPDRFITRAELCTIINNAFGYVQHEYISFNDLTPLDPFYLDMSIAVCAGYLTGYNDNTIRPNNNITRAQAAVIYTRLADLEENPDAVKRFWDAYAIPDWAKGYVGACVEAGIMNGYEDQSFLSGMYQTRAEAVVCIYAAMYYVPERVFITIDSNYGPREGISVIEGDVMIVKDGIILQNLHIKGDMILHASIGKGRLFLRNVTVDGETYVEYDDTDNV